MAGPSRPVTPPFEGADQLITAGWAIALLVLARGQLPAADHWWIWTCVAGVGLFGLAYVPQLKKSRRRRREQARPAPGG